MHEVLDAVVGEGGRLGALAVEHGLVLDRAHGEHLGQQPVELVEAAPRARRAEALVDVGHRAVVHLGAAVEDVDGLAERGRQVLGRLGLAGARGAGGRAAEVEVRRLRGGDVDAVGERRDHEAARVAEVLERVLEGRVADVGPDVVLRRVAALLEARLELADPLEAVLRVELVLDHRDDDVARVRLHRDQVHRLAAVVLLEAAVLHEHDQVVHHLDLVLVVVLHRLALAEAHLVEGDLDVARPRPLRHHDASWPRWLASHSARR